MRPLDETKSGLFNYTHMAKELPFFKFEPNQWENGNIQINTREDKGLFIDLCSMYWSRLGDVPFKLAVQKLCNGNADAFDSLLDSNIFAVIDDMICIDFLNEQLLGFEENSKVKSKNARDGWIKRRLEGKSKATSSNRNASASNPQSEKHAIREEKIREENTDIILYPSFEDFWDEYNKKSGNKKDCEKKWNKIDQKTKEKIIDHVKDYVISTPEVSFRKNPETYLNQEHWNNEILIKENYKNLDHGKLKELAYSIKDQYPNM